MKAWLRTDKRPQRLLALPLVMSLHLALTTSSMCRFTTNCRKFVEPNCSRNGCFTAAANRYAAWVGNDSSKSIPKLFPVLFLRFLALKACEKSILYADYSLHCSIPSVKEDLSVVSIG
uniref:Secreted protein n=1 Tax=Anopheles culicifacies TaxID=139723 RepID=A0A182LY52_9DIPT